MGDEQIVPEGLSILCRHTVSNLALDRWSCLLFLDSIEFAEWTLQRASIDDYRLPDGS